MEIGERIAKIIASEGLTASAFADKIGIQRSNVSHILNGRNGQPSNPSFEVLQKILATFPQYNTDWLVMGRGEIRRKPVQMSIFDEIGEPEPVATNIITDGIGEGDAANQPETGFEQEAEPAEPQASIGQPSAQATDNSNASFAPLITEAAQRSADVKQIVVLYTDNTFSIYNKQ